MVKRLSRFLLATGLVAIVGAGCSTLSAPAQAQCVGFDCVESKIDKDISKNTANDNSVESIVATITNTIIYLVGVASIIMLIYGGILYTISAGDSTKTKKAKDTIMYALIGLVVAVLSFALVRYVVSSIAV